MNAHALCGCCLLLTSGFAAKAATEQNRPGRRQRRLPEQVSFQVLQLGLQRHNLGGARAFLALSQFKLYFLAVIQGFVT